MNIPIARKKDGPKDFTNGYGEVEWIPGSHKLVKSVKGELKEGNTVTPETFKDKIVVYCFVKGTGYITTRNAAYNIKELSFFVPDFDKEKFSIYASSDLEIMKFIVDMLDSDKAQYKKTHIILPMFKSLSQTQEYTQDCKGPNTTSWSVINRGTLSRVLMGVVRGTGSGEGTIEKGHPSVDQWNYILDDSDITMDVEGEITNHKGGELSFIKAGPDHSLVASGPDKTVFYIWFEHMTAEFK